jgi:hypothetical protein
MRLEEKRRCGWRANGSGGTAMVWARGGAVAMECPKTAITAESEAWVEMFAAWRGTGLIDVATLTARDHEALATLKREWEKTIHDER